jgi:hypothetical protein
MRSVGTLLILLLTCSPCRAERVVFAGFDSSGSARRGGNNPYDAGWMQVLSTVEGGDHIYGSVINEKGLANGAPIIDFTIRPYSFLTDGGREYDAAVRAKLEKQRETLNNIFRNTTPSKRTEIIGFLHSAAQILGAYPPKTVKEVVIWTDGIQEGDEVDLARIAISDEEISKIIETERRSGRLPKLNGVAVWFVTSPSVESTQFTTSKLLRLEAFWRKYVQACGGEVKAFSPVLVNFGGHMAMGNAFPTSPRSNSPPLNKGATMYWPDDMELLRLNNAGDRLLLNDLFDGTLITGGKGSGKTSATAAHLHAGLLEAQCGGLVACPKITDARDYMALFRRRHRDKDVTVLRPTANWREKPLNSINVLDAWQKWFGRGQADVDGVTTLLMTAADLNQRKNGQGAGGGDAAFWKSFAEKIIKAGLTAQSINSNRFDLKNLLKFVNSLPNSPEQTENQNLYSVAQVQEAAAKLGENPPYEFTSVWDFVMHEWPNSPPNSRGSGALTVQVLLGTLLSQEIRQLLFEETTFDLDRLNHGGILLLDMDVQTYPKGGLVGMILKELVSRWCQARPELSTLAPECIAPIYILYDEFPEYAVDADEAHARTARSARLIPIFITQSTTSLKAQFHDKDKASALLDLAGCRFAHSNGSNETNTWMADTIGKVIVRRGGGQDGSNVTYGPQNQYGHNQGQNYTEQVDYDCPPRAFTRLLRGGLKNNLKVESILWRNSDRFGWNGRRWLPVVIPQDFKPGRDEVRVVAQKGGNNRDASKLASLLSHPVAKDGWERLRKILG